MYLHNVQEARLHKLMYKNQHETLPIKAWEYKVHVVASWLAIFNYFIKDVCLFTCFFVCLSFRGGYYLVEHHSKIYNSAIAVFYKCTDVW